MRMTGSPALEAMLAFASRRAGMPDDLHLDGTKVVNCVSAFAVLIPGGRPVLECLADKGRVFLSEVMRFERMAASDGRPELVLAVLERGKAVFPAVPISSAAQEHHEFGDPAHIDDPELLDALLLSGHVYESHRGQYAWSGLDSDDILRRKPP